MPYTTLKMAVFAPMPTASVMIAASANDLLWVSSRNRCRASCRKCSSQVIVHSSRASPSERIQAAIALPPKGARIVPQATSSNQLKNVDLGIAPRFEGVRLRATLSRDRTVSPHQPFALRPEPRPHPKRPSSSNQASFHFCFPSDETGTSESNGGVHGAFSGGGNGRPAGPGAFGVFFGGVFSG